MDFVQISDLNAIAVAHYQQGNHARAAETLIEAFGTIQYSIACQNSCHARLNFKSTCSNNHVRDFHNLPTVELQDGFHASLNRQMKPSGLYQDSPFSPLPVLRYGEIKSPVRCIVAPPDVYAVFPSEKVVDDSSVHQLSSDMYHGGYLLTYDIPVSEVETVAVLSYNLALVLHSEGIKHGNSYPIAKALELYQQAYFLIENNEQSLCPSSSSVVITVMTAAICCNMAHIYSFFQNRDLAKFSIDRLSRLTLYMQAVKMVRQEDLEYFHTCIFFSNSSACCPAAAA